MKASEQRALTQIREDAAALVAALGSRAGAQTLYLAELAAGGQGLEDAGGNRVLGRGCLAEQAPRFARKPMVHVLTLDLSQVPGLTHGYGAARAVSVYVHNLEEYSGFELGEKETRVVPSLEEPAADADGIPFVLHPVLVPAVATLGGDDDAALRGLLSKTARRRAESSSSGFGSSSTRGRLATLGATARSAPTAPTTRTSSSNGAIFQA